MSKLLANELGKAKILYAVITTTNNGVKKFEIGFEVTHRQLGEKPDSPTEQIPAYETFTMLHLDEDGDADGKKRNIARDMIRRLTGQEIKDEWTEQGYLRLTPDAKNSLVPSIEGKDVVVKTREYNSKVYYDLFFPRERPKALTVAEVKKLKKPY